MKAHIFLSALLWAMIGTINAVHAAGPSVISASLLDGTREASPDLLAPTAPKPILPKDYKKFPGIRNPKFLPQCKWVESVYVCADFAKDYCLQFPTPSDCRYVSIPFDEDSSHALNLTRVSLGDGWFLYCFVEPQSNEVISCWVGDHDDWDSGPNYVYRALCLYYRTFGTGSSCDNLIVPYITYPYDQIPDWRCHSTTGGTRCEGSTISSSCWANLKGEDGVLNIYDCLRLRSQLPVSCTSNPDEFQDVMQLLGIVCRGMFGS